MITKNSVKVTLFEPATMPYVKNEAGRISAKTVCEFHFSNLADAESFQPGKFYNILPDEINNTLPTQPAPMVEDLADQKK
jgi:hypothetical protein